MWDVEEEGRRCQKLKALVKTESQVRGRVEEVSIGCEWCGGGGCGLRSSRGGGP